MHPILRRYLDIRFGVYSEKYKFNQSNYVLTNIKASLQNPYKIMEINWEAMALAINDPEITDTDLMDVYDLGTWEDNKRLKSIFQQIANPIDFEKRELDDYL